MAWLREHGNEYCSVKREAEDAMREASEEVNFAGSEYLQRHNKALMVFAAEWGKRKRYSKRTPYGTKSHGRKEQYWKNRERSLFGTLNTV